MSSSDREILEWAAQAKSWELAKYDHAEVMSALARMVLELRDNTSENDKAPPGP